MVIYKYGIQVTENVNSHALHLLRKRNNHDIISHGFWKKPHQVNHSSFNQKLLDIPFSKIQKDSEFRDNGFCLSVCLLAFLCFVFLRGCLLVCFFFWGGGGGEGGRHVILTAIASTKILILGFLRGGSIQIICT